VLLFLQLWLPQTGFRQSDRQLVGDLTDNKFCGQLDDTLGSTQLLNGERSLESRTVRQAVYTRPKIRAC